MRNISFMLTTDQIRNRTKTVTRRLGWKSLQPGTRLMGVVKGMGLKPGETVERLGEIVVVSATREPLNAITREDVAREGFPHRDVADFIRMFCEHMDCEPDAEVTRIEFEYVKEPT